MPTEVPTWEDTVEEAPAWEDTIDPAEAPDSIGGIVGQPPVVSPLPFDFGGRQQMFEAAGVQPPAEDTNLELARALSSEQLLPYSPPRLDSSGSEALRPYPLMPGPPVPRAVVNAAYNVLGKGSYDFLNTPLGVATLGLGAAPRAVQRLAALGFGAEMAKGAAQTAGEASVTGDPQQMLEAGIMAAPIPFLVRPSVRFGENIALTRGDRGAIAGRELARNIEAAELPISESAPVRQLGIEAPPPNPFFNPGVMDLAGRAIEESQRRAILEPGAEPALMRLRREFEPPQIQEVASAPKAEPLGGQISFASPAEARAIPSARQSAVEGGPRAIQPEATQPVRDVRQQPGEVAREVSRPEDRLKVDEGRSEGTAAQAPEPILAEKDLKYPEGGGRPTPTPEWANSVISKLDKEQAWRDVFEEAASGRVALTNTAEAIGLAIRQEGAAALPKLREAMRIRDQILEQAKANLESPDPQVQSKAYRDIIATQFFSEAIEAATRNAKTEQFYSKGKHPPIDIPRGDTSFDRIEQIKEYRLEQERLNEKATPIQKEEVAPELEVERVTSLDPASGVALSATDALINKLEGLKFKGPQEARLYSLPHPDAIRQIGKTAWNNGVDVAIAAIKAGRAVKDAVTDAIDYIKKNASGFDEAQVRANLESILKEEAPGPVRGDQRVRGAQAPPPIPGRPARTLEDVYKIFEPESKARPGLRDVGSSIVEAVRTGLSSKFRPINKLAEDVAKAYGRPSKDIAGIMEQLKGSRGRGEADVYRFDRAVSDLVKGGEKDFNPYMFLRRSLDRLARDAATGESRRQVSDYTHAELRELLGTLENKLGSEKLEKFQQAADAYQQHMDQALRLQVESGRMSPEMYRAIKDGNQFYAPFKLMKYLQKTSRPEGTGARVDTMAEFTKAMKGIEDKGFKLGDMLAAGRQGLLISRILADKNLAMRNVAELAAFDVDGRFIKRLEEGQNAPIGSEVVHVMEGGKPSRFATRPEVAEALQIHHGTGGGIISRILSAFSVPFRAGATTFNIPFQVSNLLADVPRQALISKYGVRGVSDLVRYPLDFIQALYSSVMGDVAGHHTKIFQDFLDSGVAGVTIQEHLTPSALQFREPTNISKSRRLAETVLFTLPRFAAAIEQTSKVMGVQRAMRFEGKESGAQLAKEIPAAITELRRFSGSPDFGRQGKWVEQARLNLVYMFLNARIQGSVADIGRLTGRDGAKTAGQTWFKVATAVGLPTAYLYALNNRPEYREDYAKRPQQEKDNYWLIPKDTFITTEDGETMRDYWRIPKREVSKWVANSTEAALTFAQRRDAAAFSNWAEQMIEDISPVNIQGDSATERMESVASSLNPVMKAPLEIATGRDFYRHRDMIPESQKKASPELQFTDRTAEAFKALATVMPDVAPEFLRSPIILENLTRNMTAGLLTQMLPRKPVQGREGFENQPLMQRFQALPYTDQQAFKDQMRELEREGADESLIRHRSAMKLLEDNKGLPLDQIVSKAPADERLLRHIVDLWVAKQNGATFQDRQILALPVRQRAAYVADQLKDMTPEQKGQAILDLARKRILTEAVASEIPNHLQ